MYILGAKNSARSMQAALVAVQATYNTTTTFKPFGPLHKRDVFDLTGSGLSWSEANGAFALSSQTVVDAGGFFPDVRIYQDELGS
jgi:hypothetical protein